MGALTPQFPEAPNADPEGMENCGLCMSNLDRSIDEGFEAALRASPALVCGEHFATNHYGLVWFSHGLFYEQVWLYRRQVASYGAETLEALMKIVNDDYGWE